MGLYHGPNGLLRGILVPMKKEFVRCIARGRERTDQTDTARKEGRPPVQKNGKSRSGHWHRGLGTGERGERQGVKGSFQKVVETNERDNKNMPHLKFGRGGVSDPGSGGT